MISNHLLRFGKKKLSEFSFIDRFVSHFPRASPGVALGPGDDCAALRVTPGHLLCATTDALAEGVHFDRRFFRPSDIGHKALAVNLSDLAAMGATPRWFLCAIALANESDARLALAAAPAMAALARSSGCALVGGNVTRGKLSLTITALGEAPHAALLTRSGARPGDILGLVGNLGDAAQGLLRLRPRKRPPSRPTSAERAQLRPIPRLAAGTAAAAIASAAIDISDGLAQDAGHLAAASRCGLRIDLSSVPISPAVRALPERQRWNLVASGGEDYALLLTAAPHRLAALEKAIAKAGEHFVKIGEVVSGSGVRLRTADGKRFPASSGFSHL